jgi:hypothetical protein
MVHITLSSLLFFSNPHNTPIPFSMELLPATSTSVLRHLNALGYQDVSSEIVQGFVKELNEMMGEDTVPTTLGETEAQTRERIGNMKMIEWTHIR